MYQIAFYGKGGIGKSTMAANISVALAGKGARVMQIGCDPKHDSTRLLLGGRVQTTVLDYVREVPAGKRKIEDVMMKGTSGILCIEAGGPEPGIGCAGRGILTAFDTLKKLGADDYDVEVKIYDVLGDVVCGGFAVPLRGEYADGIVLVTSGEFMSLYAANNIMKGLTNFDTGKPRLIGIILNSRGVEGEEETVRRFAEAAGTKIIAVIPRHRLFYEAESSGHTVREMFPSSKLSETMDSVAQYVIDVRDGKNQASFSHPLNDDQMSDLAAGREIRRGTCGEALRPRCTTCNPRTSIKESKIMSSCAAYGAAAAYLKMNDVAVVLHGPLSCAYLMDTARAKAVLELYAGGIYSTDPNHNLRCTMMDDSSSIFGGVGNLERTLSDTIEEGYRKIAVVTTCMPGIIGDDSLTVIKKVIGDNPGVSIHYVPADGDVNGEFTDGFMMAVEKITETMDTSLERERGTVNIIGTSFFDLHSLRNAKEVEKLFSAFGLKENCRFLDETSSEAVAGFCRGHIDLMVNDSATTREMASIIESKTERVALSVPLPVGLHDYVEWVRQIGKIMDLEEEAEREIERAESDHEEFIEAHSRHFRGRKVIVMNRTSQNIDWLIDMLIWLGAEICRVGCVPSARKSGSRSASRHSDIIMSDYDTDDLRRDLANMDPDLIIGEFTGPIGSRCRISRIGKIGIGILPTKEYVEYLENIMRLPREEGWKEGRKV